MDQEAFTAAWRERSRLEMELSDLRRTIEIKTKRYDELSSLIDAALADATKPEDKKE